MVGPGSLGESSLRFVNIHEIEVHSSLELIENFL